MSGNTQGKTREEEDYKKDERVKRRELRVACMRMAVYDRLKARLFLFSEKSEKTFSSAGRRVVLSAASR